MANFSVQVRKIMKKANHPNADRLTIYNVGGYNCISNKIENENGEYVDRYNIGDLVVYIPTESIVPKWLLKKMDLWNNETNCGMLCGSEGNRVKSVKLRGIPSEGLLYPVRNEKDETFIETKDFFKLVREGDNVGEILEIEKYIPPIPASMGGEIFHSSENIAEHYDVEPIQLYEHLLIDGEPIEIQEKIHGCACYDTIIDTLNHGKIKIGDFIESGYTNDMVKSFNHDTGEIEYSPILGTSIQDNINNWYELELSNGYKVKLTGNHKVWCENLKIYRAVEDLDGTEQLLIDI